MGSLWLKLMSAFALVILVGTGVVVFLVGRATTGQFDLYVTQTGQQWAVRLAPLLADHYARSGSWTGVEAVLRNPWLGTGWDGGYGRGDDGSYGRGSRS